MAPAADITAVRRATPLATRGPGSPRPAPVVAGVCAADRPAPVVARVPADAAGRRRLHRSAPGPRTRTRPPRRTGGQARAGAAHLTGIPTAVRALRPDVTGTVRVGPGLRTTLVRTTAPAASTARKGN